MIKTDYHGTALLARTYIPFQNSELDYHYNVIVNTLLDSYVNPMSVH
jgi:hypothetical protein